MALADPDLMNGCWRYLLEVPQGRGDVWTSAMWAQAQNRTWHRCPKVLRRWKRMHRGATGWSPAFKEPIKRHAITCRLSSAEPKIRHLPFQSQQSSSEDLPPLPRLSQQSRLLENVVCMRRGCRVFHVTPELLHQLLCEGGRGHP